MQTRNFDGRETNDNSSQGITDTHDLNAEQDYFFKRPDPRGVFLSRINGIDPSKQSDTPQISECCCCMQGHSSIARSGVDGCSSSADPFNVHKSFKCKNNNDWVDQERAVASTSSEDHCTCYRFGVNHLDSVSSVESLIYDDEVADELLNAEGSQESNQYKDPHASESYASKVEELQLDLLECALEYEVKILEMKMKMVQMRSHNEDPVHGLEKDQTLHQFSTEQPELPERLDTCRKKMNKLQVQRDSLAKELLDFRKKQRKFELQRRNMEDLLRRVNNLQRKLIKKEEEMVECQLKEKEARARLHELQVALQRSKAKNYEPEQLVKLIPSIRSWLRSLKKSVPIKGNPRQLLQVGQFEAVLGRILESAPHEFLKNQGQASTRKVPTTNIDTPRMEHSAPVDCIREVYALQKELQRLAVSR